MFPSARSPGSCRNLREHGLHLDGNKWSKYVLSCPLLCATFTDRRKTIPRLCVSERNRPMPVWRRFNLTHAGLGKLNPRDVELTSLLNVWNLEVFSSCLIYIPPIVLHWCLTGRDCVAVPVQQAEMGSWFKLPHLFTKWRQEPFI